MVARLPGRTISNLLESLKGLVLLQSCSDILGAYVIDVKVTHCKDSIFKANAILK